MKTAICIALATVCALASAVELPAELKSRYQTEKSLIESKNLSGFTALFADGYTWTLPDGKSKNKAQSIAEMAPMFKAQKIVLSEKFTKCVKHGDTYEVSFDAKLTIVVSKKTTSHYHEVGADTWKKVGGNWLIIKTVDTVSQ